MTEVSNLLIIGATSAIATATARRYASVGARLFLVARNSQQLKEVARDVEVRGAAAVATFALDAGDFDNHQKMIDSAVEFLGQIDTTLICHGLLPDQQACEEDWNKAADAIMVNGTSTLSMLTGLTKVMIEQERGCLAVVTSVAGDRGRVPNFVYGAAKSLVSTYLQGLRGKLHSKGVHVLEIRPGFVDTPMTAHIEEKGLLFSSPDKVADIIVSAVRKKKHIVYAPGYWRLILFIVKAIPEAVFKRLKI